MNQISEDPKVESEYNTGDMLDDRLLVKLNASREMLNQDMKVARF